METYFNSRKRISCSELFMWTIFGFWKYLLGFDYVISFNGLGFDHPLWGGCLLTPEDFRARTIFKDSFKGKTIDQAGVPESFRVLVKEFQALGLDVQVIDNNDNVVEFKDIEEDEDDNDAFRIDEIDVTTNELNNEEVVEDNLEEYKDEFEEEEDLDSLEFPGDIEEDILNDGEGEE